MKPIGFIKEHSDYPFAKKLNPFYLLKKEEVSHRQEILKYLKKGILCVSLMGLAEDAEENNMGFIAVDTDGEWCWPEYLYNYLEKYPNFKIEEDFIKHVLKNKEKEIELSEEELLKIEKEFLKIAGFK